MKIGIRTALLALTLIVSSNCALAAPAMQVLGKDFAFPNTLDGLPAKLSDFKGLQINSFETSDGVKLSYWEAGSGKPLVFIPGWSANGAEFINVMYLLSKDYHVYVLDPRNQGLSQQVDYGTRITRFSADLKEFSEHLGLKSADYCGWSMGAAVLWGYIDLFGTKGIRKVVFVDEPVSIYSHADWTEQERLDAGGMTSSAERMVATFTSGTPTNALVTEEVESFLADRLAAVIASGVSSDRIVLDPGFGFGKTLAQNLELFRSLPRLGELGLPLLVGMSRKSMLGEITGKPVIDRVAATVATSILAEQRGATCLRVHDVRSTMDALSIWRAIEDV